MPEEFSPEKAQQAIESGIAEAQEYLSDPTKLNELMKQLEASHRKRGADDRMQRALHEEGPTDEAVRRTHQAHDGDFLATRHDGEANRVVDEHERDEHEQDDQRNADVTNIVRHREQALDRTLTVFQRIGRVVFVGNLLELVR